MKFLLALFVAIIATCLQCEAKKFSVCGLVHELRRQGFRERDLRDWVCLVEHESSFKTDAIGPPNTDGSRDHGLFQINDKYWCSDSNVPGKECGVTCAQVRTDDITRASKCAKKIFGIHGFAAWNGWKEHCKGRPLPDISHC